MTSRRLFCYNPSQKNQNGTNPNIGIHTVDELRVRLLGVFCFQIHAHAYCTMNKKFSILHESVVLMLNLSSLLNNRLAMASHPTYLNEKTMN